VTISTGIEPIHVLIVAPCADRHMPRGGDNEAASGVTAARKTRCAFGSRGISSTQPVS